MNAPSLDAAGRSPSLAPPTIFPLPAGQVAAITVDFIGYDVTVGWNRLATAFDSRGFDVDPVPFMASNGRLEPGATVMTLNKREMRLTIHAQATGQLLLELLDVERYADAVAEYGDRHPDDCRAPSGVVTFSNERAVWR